MKPHNKIKIALKECSSGYHRKGETVILLNNINLSVKQGELVALIGKNGSGKTTLLKNIAGLHPLLKGNICFDEIILDDLSSNELAKKTGFHSALIPENQEMIVEDLVRLGRFPYTNLFGILNSNDFEIIDNAISVCGIHHLRRKNLGQLSDGERQRAMLARVFAQDTDIILLDEPTSHLDIPNKYEILNLLRNLAQKGKTILFTTHDLHLASAYSDKIWLIHRKSIIEGAPEDLFLGDELREQFITDKLRFDADSGEFIPNYSTPFQVTLIAEKNCNSALRWTKKALRRKGIGIRPGLQPIDSSGIHIEILKENDKFVWNLSSNGQNISLTGIYQLVSKLEKLFKNDFH